MSLKLYENGTGCLYDTNGNRLCSFEGTVDIEEIKCDTEEQNDIIKRYNNIGCTSFTFTIDEFDDKFDFLTKRQNHLYKYGKYRVRKKYMNKVYKMLKKILEV